jgi:lysine-N-methylase
MASLPLQLPTLQNWSCHNCAGCCRQHLIEITEAERARILAQGWTTAEGLPPGPPVVWFAGWPWKKRYRLAHRPDGGCVFLDERGLCRIHARFGEAAKPLACRVYPYAFHPHGKSVAVSLRYSCPSVVGNRGQPVPRQRAELQRLASEIVPPGADRLPPPPIARRHQVTWKQFDALVEPFDRMLAKERLPLSLRLLQLLAYANLLAQARFDKLDNRQIQEFVDLVTGAIAAEFQTAPERMDEPSAVGRLYFRLFAAQYARKDTVATAEAGWRGRWQLFRAILRFSRGTGEAPPLQDVFRPVPFADLERPHGPLPSGAVELFTRYLRVKVLGLHFCGPAFYGFPVVDGWHSLTLMVPITLWLARWLARSAQREVLELSDIEHALALADHHHGYNEALGQPHARRRIRQLAESGDLARLLFWYDR